MCGTMKLNDGHKRYFRQGHFREVGLALSYDPDVVPSSEMPVVRTMVNLSPICSQTLLCHPPHICICIRC